MPLQADGKYLGKVASGSEIIESQTGTLAYQVMIDSNDGNTFYLIWLTPKNRDRATRDFEILGVDAAKLTDERYVQYQLAQDIVGRPIKFGIVEEEYQGRTKLKVAWIGKPGANGNAPRAVADFFSGKASVSNSTVDDGIPF